MTIVIRQPNWKLYRTVSWDACRVIADALGGEVDAETSELSYNADGATVANALMALSDSLGTVEVTRTISGACNIFMLSSILQQVYCYHSIMYQVTWICYAMDKRPWQLQQCRILMLQFEAMT